MARSVKDTGGSKDETRKHNAKARRGQIKSVFQRLQALEDKRKEIGDEIRSLLNSEVKGDLGFKISDFKASYRLYLLEGDARDEMLDTLHECFDSLGLGEQLDWIQLAERVKNRPADEQPTAEA